jgi:hypothetical protein
MAEKLGAIEQQHIRNHPYGRCEQHSAHWEPRHHWCGPKICPRRLTRKMSATDQCHNLPYKSKQRLSLWIMWYCPLPDIDSWQFRTETCNFCIYYLTLRYGKWESRMNPKIMSPDLWLLEISWVNTFSATVWISYTCKACNSIFIQFISIKKHYRTFDEKKLKFFSWTKQMNLWTVVIMLQLLIVMRTVSKTWRIYLINAQYTISFNINITDLGTVRTVTHAPPQNQSMVKLFTELYEHTGICANFI